MVTIQSLVTTFAEAIAIEEKLYKDCKITPISQRLANPGAMLSWRTARGFYPTQNGYVKFPECSRANCTNPDHPYEVGFDALRSQCRMNIVTRKLSFLEFFQGKRSNGKTQYMGYLQSSGRLDPRQYATNVMKFVVRKVDAPRETNIYTPIISLAEPAVQSERAA